jgi:hypothetical protein
MLPTPTELAAIAATMATDEASFEGSARKALLLWKACEKEIARESKNDEYWQNSEREEDEFLTRCGLDRDHINSAHILPLEVFLKAVIPSSSKNTSMRNWQKFWIQENENSGRKDPGQKWAYEDSHLPKSPDQGIRRDSLIDLRMQFQIFLKKQKEATGSKSGTAGPRAKRMYAAVNAVLEGAALKPEDIEILKGMTNEEKAKAASHLELKVTERRKLDAKITSLGTPVRAKPRVVIAE